MGPAHRGQRYLVTPSSGIMGDLKYQANVQSQKVVIGNIIPHLSILGVLRVQGISPVYSGRVQSLQRFNEL